ncbi:MAG: hypothetical protein FWG64_02055 [Firmicutes bacterium]|nr:hypothetical protein [Bacillota bacterium]
MTSEKILQRFGKLGYFIAMEVRSQECWHKAYGLETPTNKEVTTAIVICLLNGFIKVLGCISIGQFIFNLIFS